jgi:hypothetical protein
MSLWCHHTGWSEGNTQTFIWEVLGLILGQDTGYPDWRLSPHANTREVPQVVIAFFQIPFSSVIIASFDAVCTFNTGRVFKKTHNFFMGKISLCFKAVSSSRVDESWQVSFYLLVVKSGLQMLQTFIGLFCIGGDHCAQRKKWQHFKWNVFRCCAISSACMGNAVIYKKPQSLSPVIATVQSEPVTWSTRELKWWINFTDVSAYVVLVDRY